MYSNALLFPDKKTDDCDMFTDVQIFAFLQC
jgi:hypothetical protein